MDYGNKNPWTVSVIEFRSTSTVSWRNNHPDAQTFLNVDKRSVYTTAPRKLPSLLSTWLCPRYTSIELSNLTQHLSYLLKLVSKCIFKCIL